MSEDRDPSPTPTQDGAASPATGGGDEPTGLLSDDPAAEAVIRALQHDDASASELLPRVYDQLRTLAGARLSKLGNGHTLEPTALVHEAWLRVSRGTAGSAGVRFNGKAHFFGAAATAMRDILVERARKRHTVRHGGGRSRVALDEAAAPDPLWEAADLLALDEALSKLQELSPLKAQVVQLRYFAGLTMPEIADVVGCGLTKVESEWRFARAWLQFALDNDRVG